MPRKVDPLHNDDDLEVLYAGASGRSNHCINGITGQSNGQIYYRLRKEGIRRMDFRNNNSEFAKEMYEMGREVFLKIMLTRLRKKYRAVQPVTKKRKRPVAA